jgi:SPX domain protein involved in polyphosphate accumulation
MAELDRDVGCPGAEKVVTLMLEEEVEPAASTAYTMTAYCVPMVSPVKVALVAVEVEGLVELPFRV